MVHIQHCHSACIPSLMASHPPAEVTLARASCCLRKAHRSWIGQTSGPGPIHRVLRAVILHGCLPSSAKIKIQTPKLPKTDHLQVYLILYDLSLERDCSDYVSIISMLKAPSIKATSRLSRLKGPLQFWIECTAKVYKPSRPLLDNVAATWRGNSVTLRPPGQILAYSLCLRNGQSNIRQRAAVHLCFCGNNSACPRTKKCAGCAATNLSLYVPHGSALHQENTFARFCPEPPSLRL